MRPPDRREALTTCRPPQARARGARLKFFTEAWRNGEDSTPGPTLWDRYQQHLDACQLRSERAGRVLRRCRQLYWHDARLSALVARPSSGSLAMEFAVPEAGARWRSTTLSYEGVEGLTELLTSARQALGGGPVDALDDEWDLDEAGALVVHRWRFWVGSAKRGSRWRFWGGSQRRGSSQALVRVACQGADWVRGEIVEWPVSAPRFLTEE